jgi:hypothetical protein
VSTQALLATQPSEFFRRFVSGQNSDLYRMNALYFFQKIQGFFESEKSEIESPKAISLI